MGEDRRLGHLAVEEDAIVGHEDVIEDDEALRVVVITETGKSRVSAWRGA